jgi:hypothetical protein
MKKISDWIGIHNPVSADYAGKQVMSVLLLLLAYRWYAGRFSTLIIDAPLVNPELDNTFWAVLATGIPAWIIQHESIAFSLDLLVIAAALWGYSSPEKKLPFLLFIVLFFLQTIINEAYTSQHSKTVVCIFLALIPFCFSGSIWLRLWELARYYLLFVMVVSAIYKLTNGALTDPDHFSKTLLYQHADILTLHPEGWQSLLIDWLIIHPTLCFSLFILLFLVQLSFLIGFFTKKFDRLLVAVLIVFCCMSYVLMRIYNFDLTILAVPLWYSSAMARGIEFANINESK